MKLKQYLLAGAAFAVLSIGSAVAADLPVKAYTPAPVVPPFTWTGWYFGGHLGAGWARKDWGPSGCDWYDCGDSSSNVLGSTSATGVLGGLQGGYNWQTGNWVFGIEAEYSWANLKGNSTNSASASNAYDGYGYYGGPYAGVENAAVTTRVATKINSIGTIAGRFGVASDLGFGRTLWYVKLGGAVVRDKYNLSGNASYSDICAGDCYYGYPSSYSDTASFSGSASATKWGWLLGTGLEFALNQSWSAKIEYDYMDFGSKDVTFAVSGRGYESCCGSYGFSSSRTVNVDQTVQVVKFGVNYRFGGGAWGGSNWGW